MKFDYSTKLMISVHALPFFTLTLFFSPFKGCVAMLKTTHWDFFFAQLHLQTGQVMSWGTVKTETRHAAPRTEIKSEKNRHTNQPRVTFMRLTAEKELNLISVIVFISTRAPLVVSLARFFFQLLPLCGFKIPCERN